ncbi:MAG: hypothetical protein K8J31_14615 [Anaerolineae bacterium]|nr:hypothetical protein [Anaerolineae bacterium]
MNIFFLAAGLLLLLLSIAHALWGETRLFKLLTPPAADGETFVSLYVPWHQITYLLAASGMALIYSAIQGGASSLTYFVLAIVAGNFSLFILICLIKGQTQLFKKTIPQTVLFLLLIMLIILGTIS